MTPPRVFCIPAARAPIVAVFRRGPTTWAHVGRWDLRGPAYEEGAWLRGRLFPRRSDLSPDGRLLCYFAHQPGARWPHGDTYVGVSRLPWLTALHAFGTCGTWTRGYHFTGREEHGDHGNGTAPAMPWGLRATRAGQFASELRHGWEEAPDSPPRLRDDLWDDRRRARVRKPHPQHAWWLRAESVGEAGGEVGSVQAVDGLCVRYWVEGDGILEAITDVQWADWDEHGRLLVATRAGRLEVRTWDPDGWSTTWSHDLSGLVPDPRPAPDWAGQW